MHLPSFRQCCYLSCLLKQLSWLYVIRTISGWLVLFGRSSLLTHTWWVKHAGSYRFIHVEISVGEWLKENAWHIHEAVVSLCRIIFNLVTINLYFFLFVPFRTLRNIFTCLKEIVDVLLVLLLMIAIFAVMGKVWKLPWLGFHCNWHIQVIFQ